MGPCSPGMRRSPPRVPGEQGYETPPQRVRVLSWDEPGEWPPKETADSRERPPDDPTSCQTEAARDPPGGLGPERADPRPNRQPAKASGECLPELSAHEPEGGPEKRQHQHSRDGPGEDPDCSGPRW